MTHRLFTLDSQRIADLIRSAERFDCYSGLGVKLALFDRFDPWPSLT